MTYFNRVLKEAEEEMKAWAASKEANAERVRDLKRLLTDKER